MNRAKNMTCPNCTAELKSERGVRIGRKVKCPRCAFVCTARPDAVEEGKGVNARRFGIVLGGTLLYLLGGAGLAYYCFTDNLQPNPTVLNNSVPQGNGAEDDPAPPPARNPVTVTTAEQRRIDDAIARGVWFLKDHTLPSGTWGDQIQGFNVAGVSEGFASLPGLTLLECGVPASDPVVQQTAVFVRQQAPQLGNSYDNYQRSLAILFLDRLSESNKLLPLGDEELIKYLALCLIAGQHPTLGAWSYSSPALDTALVPQLMKKLDDQNKLVLDPNPLDDWRKVALKGGPYVPPGWDNSNTQFAILALWAAQRHGVAIRHSIGLAEKHFRTTQQPSGPDPKGDNLNLDGSWFYNDRVNSSRWPSMTCAGLLALAEAAALTAEANKQAPKPPLDDPAIQRALAMLDREIARPDEQRPPDLYFLWSLERVGVLYHLPKIGDKDWYHWGVDVLLPRQQADGSWKDGGYFGNNPVLDTCFALLFLKQANLTKDLTTKLQLLQKK